MTSFSPHDIKARYCGRCHQFEDDMEMSPEAVLKTRMRPLINAIAQALADAGALGPVTEAEPTPDGPLRVRVVIDSFEVSDVDLAKRWLSDLDLAN